MVNAPGVVQCIDPKTGQIAWEQRVQTKGSRSETWSSIVASGVREPGSLAMIEVLPCIIFQRQA